MDNEQQRQAAPEHLLQGGWKTSDNHKKTSIIVGLPPGNPPLTLRVTCIELVDGDTVNFRFTVDGKQIIAHMQEGGSVFVEGTRIDIEQTNSGVNFWGTWDCVRPSGKVVDFEPATWVVHPTSSRQSLVAAFAEPQTFVLEINRSSTGCKDGVMRALVDGQQVTDQSGTPIDLLEGSSIIGYGSVISVLMTGTCDSGFFFTGRIKI